MDLPRIMGARNARSAVSPKNVAFSDFQGAGWGPDIEWCLRELIDQERREREAAMATLMGRMEEVERKFSFARITTAETAQPNAVDESVEKRIEDMETRLTRAEELPQEPMDSSLSMIDPILELIGLRQSASEVDEPNAGVSNETSSQVSPPIPVRNYTEPLRNVSFARAHIQQMDPPSECSRTERPISYVGQDHLSRFLRASRSLLLGDDGASTSDNVAQDDKRKDAMTMFLNQHGFQGLNDRKRMPPMRMRYTYALHVAAESGDKKLIKTLLEAGADPSLKNSAGKTALQVAEAKSKNGSHVGVVRYLSRAHSDASRKR